MSPQEEECVHGLTPATCSICLHGPAPRDRAEIVACRSCTAEIIWVVTEKGKSMPLDAEPSAGGRFVKSHVDAAGNKCVRYLRDEEQLSDPRPRYDSHFATCPDREEHRRAR